MRQLITLTYLIAALTLFAACADNESTRPSTLAPLPADVVASADCKQIAIWIERHADTLPSALDDFARYPEAYQRRIFAALGPDARRQLWTDKLERYLATHPDASAARIDALHRVIAGLDGLFGDMKEDVRAAAGARLQAELEAAFGEQEARALYRGFGAPAPRAPRSAPDCECVTYHSDSDCSGHHVCRYRAANCQWSAFGCGPWWLSECNGMCRN